MAENTEPTETPSATEQPPFVPEAGSVPVSVPAAARTGLPPTAQAFFALISHLLAETTTVPDEVSTALAARTQSS